MVVVTYAYASSLVSRIDRSLGSEMRVWVALLLRYFHLEFIQSSCFFRKQVRTQW